ncbi:MAG: pro-sigmaK processing inhibitor BofA family protein [Lachnotalea sp.]
MNLNQAVVLMIVMCLLVLVIVLAKNKIEFIVNILLRMVSGMICIHFLNAMFVARGIDLLVGINLSTVGTIGVLGIPGLLLIYAITALKFL